MTLALDEAMSLQREVYDISERQRRRMEDLKAFDVDFQEKVVALEGTNSRLEVELAAEKGHSEKKEKDLNEELQETKCKLKALMAKQQENNENIKKEQPILENMLWGIGRIEDGMQRIEEKVEYLRFESAKLAEKLETSTEVILKAVFDANEVQCPTSFLILPFKVGDPNFAECMASWLVKFDSISISLRESLQQRNGDLQAEEADAKTNSDSKTLRERVDSIKKRASDFLGQYTSRKSYLYLLDEVTGEIVLGDRYPIVIEKASNLVKKCLPMMRVSINAVYAFNCIGGIAHMFGAPVPALTKSFTNAAENYVTKALKESSVEEFKVLQSKLNELEDGDAGQPPEVKGSSCQELREMEAFLLENDPSPSNFCGLRRVCDKTSGKALWTNDKGVATLESKYSDSRTDFQSLQGSKQTHAGGSPDTTTSSSPSMKADGDLSSSSGHKGAQPSTGF